MEKIIDIKNLRVSFHTYAGEVQAVRDVSFYAKKGETLAIVGESGCGKSVTSKAVMGLIAQPPGEIGKESQILYHGKNILKQSEKEWKEYRGARCSMIFQDALSSLNPTMNIGKQVMENITNHSNVSKADAKKQAIHMLEMVGIPDPALCIKKYPHELSGGMRQRVMIAIALSANPEILIADEPTTALDVTIQAQILDLLREIQMKLGTAAILVSHDLGVVARVADRVAVMYAGKIVEIGTAEEVYYDPRHPYTWGLMRSLPAFANGKESLYTIPGMPPTLIDPPKGDAFACRNEYALNIDYEEMPPMFKITDTHYAATWLLDPRAPQIKSPVGGTAYE